MAEPMDLNVAIQWAGFEKNRYRLSSAYPPHTIVEWYKDNTDTQPTQAQLDAGWADYVAKHGSPSWELLRRERNHKLNKSDWMAAPDRTMTDAQKSYRQTLRDLPANTADPKNPTWPTEPS